MRSLAQPWIRLDMSTCSLPGALSELFRCSFGETRALLCSCKARSPLKRRVTPQSPGESRPARLPLAALLQLVTHSRAWEGRWVRTTGPYRPCVLTLITGTSIPWTFCWPPATPPPRLWLWKGLEVIWIWKTPLSLIWLEYRYNIYSIFIYHICVYYIPRCMLVC